MDFSAALSCVRGGVAVRRKAWGGTHVTLSPNVRVTTEGDDAVQIAPHLVQVIGDVMVAWHPSPMDLWATDWTVVPEDDSPDEEPEPEHDNEYVKEPD